MENNGSVLDNQVEKVSENEQLRQMLENNIALSQEILEIAVYIKKYIIWQKIFSYLKIFIIVVPVILALIYLPPILREGLQAISGSLNELNPMN